MANVTAKIRAIIETTNENCWVEPANGKPHQGILRAIYYKKASDEKINAHIEKSVANGVVKIERLFGYAHEAVKNSGRTLHQVKTAAELEALEQTLNCGEAWVDDDTQMICVYSYVE